MSDTIDLKKKRNRIILALDILFGTLLFSECWPTEPMSSYFWRKQKTGWSKRVDRWLGKDHCKTSYEHSMSHLFDAPEYRQINRINQGA